MKFEKIHLFIILLLALIFCSCLGGFMREGMENKHKHKHHYNHHSNHHTSQRKFDERFDKAMVTYKQQEELAKKQQQEALTKKQSTEAINSDLTATDDKSEENILGSYAMGQYPSNAPTTQNTNNQYSSGNSYKEVYGNDVVINRQPQNTITVNGSGANGEGIPRSSIPPGQEDLYILKSEIVPPVCPACPQPAACPREEKCPPCPPCARCPEPAFECKKVPNYNVSNVSNKLPVPMLNSFADFN